MAGSACLFVSDVVAELEAARAAGLHTRLAVRPGNKPVPADGPIHRAATSFDQLWDAGLRFVPHAPPPV